jgi:uncharacterized protein
MSNPKPHEFARAQAAVLAERLSEPRRHIQVVAGPRQVGKTTLVLQALRTWGERARYVRDALIERWISSSKRAGSWPPSR